MNRRQLLRGGLAATLAAAATTGAASSRPAARRVVLRSSWQTINIGDIGHTPGVLAILEQYLPEVDVVLWPSDVGNGVEAMLMRRFPKLVITKDRAVIRECDFLLHGSGPYLTAARDVAWWRDEVKKPYGIYGITMAPAGDPGLKIMKNNGLDAPTKSLLDDASFVYLRDGASLKVVQDAGVRSPVVAFGPDGAFGADVRDDARAEAFLTGHGLEAGRFLCCIPNLRNAPYWRIKPNYAFDEAKHRQNEALKEHDHAPLREAIAAVVRETGMKVLICPEDSTQMQEGQELLYTPLPDDVKPHVVHRETFWLTDEAISTYIRSAGYFGNEMHSAIMCVGNGVPAVVGRFVEQTTKGLMWRDIGVGDWLFDLDSESDRARIAPTVLTLARDPAAARAKAAEAQAFVRARQKDTMDVLRKCLA
jgi:polysaccharide pyruvyl transferase WcaK-like protein